MKDIINNKKNLLDRKIKRRLLVIDNILQKYNYKIALFEKEDEIIDCYVLDYKRDEAYVEVVFFYKSKYEVEFVVTYYIKGDNGKEVEGQCSLSSLKEVDELLLKIENEVK